MIRNRWLVLAAALALVAAPALANEPNEEDAPTPPEATTTADAPAAATTGEAEAAPPVAGDDTMRELMNLREEEETPAAAEAPPATSPAGEDPGATAFPEGAAPSATVQVNRAVLGVAPGQAKPTLRREGEFVVSRRGRIVRSPDGAHVMLAFDADAKNSPEPPMILQPSQMLETMENIVQQRGDSVVFIVSGQVHTYRGANYLLPTMMKLAVDQGNLQH